LVAQQAMGPKKQTDEKVVIRVSTSDHVAFTVSVDADKCASTSYDTVVEKIREGYAKTLQLYGQTNVQPNNVEVVSLRNFHNIHLNKDEQSTLDKICSLDPIPQSPTVGVIFRNDLKRTPDIIRWKFRGSQLDFVSNGGPQIMQDTSIISAANNKNIPPVKPAKALAQTPENSKKRKADQVSNTAPSPTPAKISTAVQSRIDALIQSGVCKKDELDSMALGRLAALPEAKGIEALNKLAVSKLPEGQNKSKHLMKVIKDLQPKAKADADSKASPAEPAAKKARNDPPKSPVKAAGANAAATPKSADAKAKPAATPKKEAAADKNAGEKKQDAKPEAEKKDQKDAKKNAKPEAKKEDKKPEPKPAKTEEKKEANKVSVPGLEELSHAHTAWSEVQLMRIHVNKHYFLNFKFLRAKLLCASKAQETKIHVESHTLAKSIRDATSFGISQFCTVIIEAHFVLKFDNAEYAAAHSLAWI
jgi:hypothetical protein